MNKKIKRFTAAILSVFALAFVLFGAQMTYAAQTEVVSEETGYRAVLEDGADLLTDEEEKALLQQMEQILPYGNVAFVTNEERNYDAAEFARTWYLDNLGEVTGTVLLVDMYNRRIQIFSGQEMYQTISEVRANEITDNIYTYASEGDYYRCAREAFSQMQTILEGGAIVTPMRYATNAAFAVGIVLLVTFIIVYRQRKKTREVFALQSAIKADKSFSKHGAVKDVKAIMTSQTKKRHVESSGGGGGGGFSGGGGGGFSGGGGGGFSGGGGGHSF